MNVRIADLMVKNVITTMPHKSLGHVKDIMRKNNISAVPVVNSDGEPVGIITSNDFREEVNDASPVSALLNGDHIYTIPEYNDVGAAARMMRKHRIHHAIVTHEKEVVGILSAFDLLKLLDDKRFVMKNPPTPSKKRRERS